MDDCLNCGAPINDTFCARCGQRADDLKRPVWSLLGQVVRETFEVDGRALRTLKMLFLHPGKLTAEYLAGRRVHYTSPLRLYLAFSLLFFLVMTWALRQGLISENPQAVDMLDNQVNFVGDDLPKIVFVFLPAFAALLKLAFYRRLYFEHLIHALHLHSVAYILLAVLFPIERAANDHWALLVLQLAAFSWLLIYIALSVKRVYATSWPAMLGKTLAVLVSYVVLLSGAIGIASSLTGIPL